MRKSPRYICVRVGVRVRVSALTNRRNATHHPSSGAITIISWFLFGRILWSTGICHGRGRGRNGIIIRITDRLRGGRGWHIIRIVKATDKAIVTMIRGRRWLWRGGGGCCCCCCCWIVVWLWRIRIIIGIRRTRSIR